MPYKELIEKVNEIALTFGVRVISALAILLIGIWVSKILVKQARKLMARAEIDELLVNFLINVAFTLLIIFVSIASIHHLGIQTASLIAVLGAAGLAIGLALQGSLSNFAAGVLIVIFRPYRVGDYLEAAGVVGTVEDMHLFSTVLKTPDNKIIFVPNAKITSDSITNYSRNEMRRIDLVVGVSYKDDIDHVKNILRNIILADSRILPEPEAIIGVLELGESSVNIAVRPWVITSDYLSVKFDLLESIKKQFDKEDISIPFPQRDVHIFKYDQ